MLAINGTAAAECDGRLQIADADDATMDVECLDCGETCPVEPDAFGDGCMTYYAAFITASPPRTGGRRWRLRTPTI